MKKILRLVACISALLALTGGPVLAGTVSPPPAGYLYPGFMGAPDWSGGLHTTRQSWDFLPIPDAGMPGTYTEFSMPLVPDANVYGGPMAETPYGSSWFYATGRVDSFAWAHNIAYGMGMENETFYGHVGGMGTGYAAFSLTPHPAGIYDVDLWAQYIVYLGHDYGPDQMQTALFSDDGTMSPAGTRTGRYWESLDGPGGTGEWWRVTEEWQVAAGTSPIVFYLETAGGTATIIDALDIQTRAEAVPVPAGIWLLGSGVLALFGIRKRHFSGYTPRKSTN